MGPEVGPPSCFRGRNLRCHDGNGGMEVAISSMPSLSIAPFFHFFVLAHGVIETYISPALSSHLSLLFFLVLSSAVLLQPIVHRSHVADSRILYSA